MAMDPKSLVKHIPVENLSKHLPKHLKTTLPAMLTPILFNSCGILPKPDKPTTVVMVHGIFDSGDRMGMLKKRIQQSGYKCLAPDLTPSNGRDGLDPLVNQLELYIKDELGEGEPYHLVGYSMGGIIARSYLRNSENRQFCASLTTLASPHHGTKIAELYPLKAGLELRPNSDYLTELNGDHKSYHPNTLSVRTTLDGVIIPSESSVLKGATNKAFNTPCHPSVLLSKRVSKCVIHHLASNDRVNHTAKKETELRVASR